MTNEYLKVANGDMELMGNIIHQMRGRRTVQDYSLDCGFAGRALTRITGKEAARDYISERMMESVYENRDPASDVTDDNVLSANGCIKASYLDAFRRKMIREGIQNMHRTAAKGNQVLLCDSGDGLFSLYVPAQPESDDRAKRRGRKCKADSSTTAFEVVETMDSALTEKEREMDRYVSYLWDLAKFSLALDVNEYNRLRMHVHRLSEDAFFCTVLHKYCELVEFDEAKDMEELRKFFRGERTDAPEWAEESRCYFDVLYDLLFVFEEKNLIE